MNEDKFAALLANRRRIDFIVDRTRVLDKNRARRYATSRRTCIGQRGDAALMGSRECVE
jgi:hypothetical protein